MNEFEMKVFEGEIGKEHWIKNYNIKCFNVHFPRKGERIVIEGAIYTIIDIIQDYDLDELNVFVKKFNFETGE